MIGSKDEPMHHSFRLLALDQSPVILQQDVTHYDLDLIGSKEATWACMLSVAKAQVIRTRRDELGKILVLAVGTHFQEPIPVKLVRIGVVVRVPVTGRCDSGY